MIHDKLIDKLEKQKPYVATHGTAYNNISALLSVIELHTPHKIPDWVEMDYEFICDGCARVYPCQTIEAIEKELING